MVTSHDVARAAGVSQATVSRALRGHPSVRPETRERVLRALEQVGYTPNAVAQAMRTRRTGTVGLVVANLTNPFYPEVVEALGAEIAGRERRMLLWNSGRGGERSAFEAIHQGLVDGLVFTTVTSDDALGDTPLREALEQQVPLVLVTRGLPEVDCDQVTGDHWDGVSQAVDHLLGLGHERIAFIGGPEHASTARERREAFDGVVAERGLSVPPELRCPGDFSHAAGGRAFAALSQLHRPPTAVVCVNDLTAFGVLDAARLAGMAVPAELSVVGYNDISLASWEAFDLTTVRQPLPEMAATALELLLDRIEEPGRSSVQRRFPNRLVVRGSTGPPSG